jgi:hypothetical protein
MSKNTYLIVLLTAAAHLAGCSKVDINSGTTAESNGASAAAARVVEIDRLLSLPLTGTSEDADRRATLRAERLALVHPHAAPVTAPPRQQAPMHDQPHSSQIVVARDTQGNHDQRMAAVDAMTPTERERYYRELKLTRPAVVVPVPVPAYHR